MAIIQVGGFRYLVLPPFKSLPPPPVPPPNEVHHADILTEIYAIASLGLEAVSPVCYHGPSIAPT